MHARPNCAQIGSAKKLNGGLLRKFESGFAKLNENLFMPITNSLRILGSIHHCLDARIKPETEGVIRGNVVVNNVDACYGVAVRVHRRIEASSGIVEACTLVRLARAADRRALINKSQKSAARLLGKNWLR